MTRYLLTSVQELVVNRATWKVILYGVYFFLYIYICCRISSPMFYKNLDITFSLSHFLLNEYAHGERLVQKNIYILCIKINFIESYTIACIIYIETDFRSISQAAAAPLIRRHKVATHDREYHISRSSAEERRREGGRIKFFRSLMPHPWFTALWLPSVLCCASRGDADKRLVCRKICPYFHNASAPLLL